MSESCNKTCYVCKETKEIRLFDNQKYHKNTVNFKCLDCLSKYGNKNTPVEQEVNGELFKLCITCNTFKEKEFNFYKTKNTKNGAEKSCKKCKGIRGGNRKNERYKQDSLYRETIKLQARLKNRQNKSYIMWRDAKYRANKQNLAFNIEIEDIKIPEVCPILGVELDLTTKNRNYSPSLDKINPKLGYIKGNVRVISFKANRLKSDLSIDNIKNLYEYVKSGIWE